MGQGNPRLARWWREPGTGVRQECEVSFSKGDGFEEVKEPTPLQQQNPGSNINGEIIEVHPYKGVLGSLSKA